MERKCQKCGRSAQEIIDDLGIPEGRIKTQDGKYFLVTERLKVNKKTWTGIRPILPKLEYILEKDKLIPMRAVIIETPPYCSCFVCGYDPILLDKGERWEPPAV